jgi:squalene-associated FAD-dependent desaturase
VNGARVAVVGGGLAGLAAALQCADAGAEVTLYEARPRLGGATYSVRRGDRWIDNGQHVVLRCCTEYLAFLRRLGVDELVPIQPRLRIPILREGRPPVLLRRGALPPPLHLAPTLLRNGLLRPRDRVAAARAAAALRKLDPSDPALDAQTFGAWLRARGQTPEAVRYLWDLIALPTLNLRADEASLALAVKVFRTGLLDSADACDIGIPAVPLQRLHGDAGLAALEAAGGRVAVRTPVRTVRRSGEEVRLELEGEQAQADAVIAAVPHHAVSALVPAAALDPALQELGASPIVNLHVHYDRPVLDEPFAAAVDSPVQWIFDRTRPAGVATGQLVVVSLSSAVREPRATFRAVPGTGRLRPGPQSRVRGVYLAGAWTDTGWPATMESAVRSGVAAARAALVGLERSAPQPPVPAGAAA